MFKNYSFERCPGQKKVLMRIAILIAAILLSYISSYSQSWPMQGYDCQRTGYSSYPGPITPEVKWYKDLARLQDNSSPIVGPDNVVYQITESGLYAINPDNTIKWSFTPLGAGGRSAPALSPDGKQIYCLMKGFSPGLKALKTQDGSQIWDYGVNSFSYSSIAVGEDGTIYFGTTLPASIYALNPDSTLKWKYTHPNSSLIGIEAPPAIGPDGSVYCIINTVGLVALDKNGNFKWSNGDNCGGYGWPTPCVLSDGTIIIAGSQGYGYDAIIAFNPDGTKKWQKSDIGEQEGYFPGVAVSKDESTIYIARSGGIMYALYAQTGKTKWFNKISSFELDGCPVLTSNGVIFIMSNSDYVYAILELDGSLLWQFQLNTSAFYWGPPSPALGPDGTLYVPACGTVPYYGNIPGRLYALKYTPYVPPTISITQPLDKSSFTSGNNIQIATLTSGGDGIIQKVELFVNSEKLGEDTISSDGFSFLWINVPVGTFKLTCTAIDNHGIKSESPPVNIIVVPAAPILTYPSNGASDTNTSPVLKWKGATDVTLYRLQLSSDDSFSSTLIKDTTIVGFTSEDFESGDFKKHGWMLSGDKNWTVVSDVKYEGGFAARSGNIAGWQQSIIELPLMCNRGYVSFYLKVLTHLSWDKLSFYIDNIQKESWTGDLSWRQVSYKIDSGSHIFKWKYEYYGGTDINAAWIDSVSFPTPSDIVYQTDKLVTNTAYFWRVKALNEIGESSWSDTWKFKTGNPTRVEPIISDSSISLKQNYPNPFTQLTKIEFYLPKPSQVEIRIYNVTGIKISTLLNEYLESGKHLVNWVPPYSVKSGIYYYQLRADEIIKTRMMIYKKE
jgi:outer membrane protein assembly factor BamB